MASTYSDLLKIELIGAGEQSGSWGTTTNNNFSQSIEHSIAGVLGVDTGSSTAVTLTTGDGPQEQADNQARQASLVFSGASANCVVTVPATQKIYIAHNTNASNTITLRISGGTTDFVLAAATSYLVACTGSAWHALNDDKVHFTAAGTISNTSSNITVDSAADIILDADGANVTIKDGGTAIGDFSNSSSDFVITASVQDKDIIFKGDDGGSAITALTLDMSDAAKAIFGGDIEAQANDITTGGVIKIDVDSDADDLTGDSATGRLTIGAGEDLNLYHGGTNSYIVNDTGDLILDTATDIQLDAAGGNIDLKKGGTQFGQISESSNSFQLYSSVSDGDMLFKGNDGGSTITALTLDMSAAGAATFNGAVIAPAGLTVDNLELKDGGNEIEATGILLLESNNNDIWLNAVGGDVAYYYGATLVGAANLATSDFILTSYVSDKDFIIKGNDGGSSVTALTIDMSAAGNATFNGTVTESSDERLKTDIRTIDNALNLVNDMRGVYFTKDNEAGTGVIAQEMEKVLPEVVLNNEEYKSVAYGKIVGVLIEAIKELKKEVETLKESK